MKQLSGYDIEERLSLFAKHHENGIKLFFILLAINLIIFGQKLFFYSLPSDDYMRFWGDENTKMLITNSARWAQALLNDYVFVGKLQILPYLNGFIGIVCLTLMGYLSARFLQREKSLEIILVALLISATAMFAHNLYFSTNITTWITLVLGLVGLFQLYKAQYVSKVIGIVLLIFSIGNYQSIIQIVALLVLFRSLLLLIKDLKNQSVVKIVWQAVWIMGLVTVAYAIASAINSYLLYYYHWQEVHRLAHVQASVDMAKILDRLYDVYVAKPAFVFFSKPISMLYAILVTLTSISVIVFVVFQREVPLNRRLLFIGIFFVAILVMPIIVNLPLLLGVDIPVRAYFPLGWVAAGFFALLMATEKGMIRSAGIILSVMLIIVNSYYISRFFDGCVRQTDADIRRANMIVERIRQSSGYKKEPIGFYIVGQKKFNVKGWQMQWQQPFNSYWAKYKIFTYFTDLQFYIPSQESLHEITQYIVEHYDKVDAYPGKHSVIVYHNTAILILTPDKINIMIQKEQNIRKIPLQREPDVNATFDLYVENNILYYYKKRCNKTDIAKKFFLRVYPKDPAHAVVNGRHIYDHQTWDFMFDLYGKETNGTCTAAVALPTSYEVGKIRTGQFGNNGQMDWDISYSLNP